MSLDIDGEPASASTPKFSRGDGSIPTYGSMWSRGSGGEVKIFQGCAWPGPSSQQYSWLY